MKKLILLAALALTSCAPMYLTITPAHSAGVTPTPGPPAPSLTLPEPLTHRPVTPHRTIVRGRFGVPAGETASATIEPQCFRVIALEALHIRSEPSEKSRVVGYALFGQRLTMIQAGAWSRIQTADQLTGYVNSRYIQEGCEP